MKRIVNAASIVVMFGIAQLASAQTLTPSQRFADSFSYMQSLSGTGPAYHAQPVLSAKPGDPVQDRSFSDTFARMQALSSNSGDFKLPASAGEPAFATADRMNVASHAVQATSGSRVSSARTDSAAPSRAY